MIPFKCIMAKLNKKKNEKKQKNSVQNERIDKQQLKYEYAFQIAIF